MAARCIVRCCQVLSLMLLLVLASILIEMKTMDETRRKMKKVKKK